MLIPEKDDSATTGKDESRTVIMGVFHLNLHKAEQFNQVLWVRPAPCFLLSLYWEREEIHFHWFYMLLGSLKKKPNNLISSFIHPISYLLLGCASPQCSPLLKSNLNTFVSTSWVQLLGMLPFSSPLCLWPSWTDVPTVAPVGPTIHSSSVWKTWRCDLEVQKMYNNASSTVIHLSGYLRLWAAAIIEVAAETWHQI